MSRTSCLAGVVGDEVAVLERVLLLAGAPSPVVTDREINVSSIGRLAPDLLLCDVDRSDVDSLELVRRLRFVLPASIIAVYTGLLQRTWALACHLAGASCLLSKESSEAELASGLRDALHDGCFTDPRFDRHADAG